MVPIAGRWWMSSSSSRAKCGSSWASRSIDITRTLVSLRVFKEFQETVIEAIREESPETARRIVARLKERRALPLQRYPQRRLECQMAPWRDPLEELIEDLEGTLPPETYALGDQVGPREGLELYVQAVSYGSAEEIARVERDPRVQAYLAATRRLGARPGA